jgi:hypothetical protein
MRSSLHSSSFRSAPRASVALAALTFLSLAAACSSPKTASPTVSTVPASRATSDRVLPEDLAMLEGDLWRGTLTYLNYKEPTRSSIPSNLRVSKSTDGTWMWATGYDEEPHANSAAAVLLEQGGTVLVSGKDSTRERVIERTAMYRGDGAPTEENFAKREARVVRIVTESSGQDDNRAATIRRVYVISAREFSVEKLVRFEGTEVFFERHVYRWRRGG